MAIANKTVSKTKNTKKSSYYGDKYFEKFSYNFCSTFLQIIPKM